MREYLNALQDVLSLGERTTSRSGETISTFGLMMKFDLRRGFPAVTTKKLMFKSVVKELLWFLRGQINTEQLGCGIWDQWALRMPLDEMISDSITGNVYGNNDVKHCYGEMWRHWPGRTRNVDQIKELIDRMEKDPDSRRHIICAWHPELQDQAGLAWCHAFVQFKVTKEYVDCCLTQRSCDMAIGVPFNIASYALLTSMIAARLGKRARYFTHYLNDAHIYVNHLGAVKEQLEREPKNLPQLILRADPKTELWDYQVEDIDLCYYDYWPPLKFEVSV